MTSNEARVSILVRALRAAIDRDWATIDLAFTDDVRAWTPKASTASRAELINELDQRDDSFSNFELDVAPLDVGGDFACVEWTLGMTHTGALTVAGQTLEPSGTRLTVYGVTVAEFHGERICALRQHWDESTVLEQLGLLNAR